MSSLGVPRVHGGVILALALLWLVRVRVRVNKGTGM